MPIVRTLIAFLSVVGMTIGLAAVTDSQPTHPAAAEVKQQEAPGSTITSSVLYAKGMQQARLVAAQHDIDVANLQAGLARKAAAVKARAAATAGNSPQSTPSHVGAVTGPCAAMAPPGFPAYIVQRESNGIPTARNASSGAYGCAQILPSHFNAGGACAGLDYAGCWSKLWAGGAGASNWACTRASGCLR